MDAADALLAARLGAGDDHALAEVYDAHSSAVLGSALRVLGQRNLAEDVVQEVFLELWSRSGRYDPSVGTLRTYLTVMARHRAIDLARSEIRRVARQEKRRLLTPEVPTATPDSEVADASAASAVREAVERLPERQRVAVEMTYFQGMTFQEMALAAGIPEGTAKSRVRLALAKLENVLDRDLLESS